MTNILFRIFSMDIFFNKKKGFEPLTLCSQNRYATKLRYFLTIFRVSKGIWTHDPQNHNLMLYQLSYTYQKWNKRIRTFECPHQKREPCHLAMFQKISALGVEPKANGLKVQCSTTELCTLKEENFWLNCLNYYSIQTKFL